jgi:hypothetical protein
MSTNARKRRARYHTTGERAPRWKSRLLDAGIVLATAVVCIFLFSISTRFGYSRSQNQEPPIVLRTQVLNACGRPGLASRTAERLGGLNVGRLRFDVIDIGNFNRTDVRRSFVINYHLTSEQARAITESIDFGPVDIIDSEIGANDLGLDFTLVLGSTVVEPDPSAPDGLN